MDIKDPDKLLQDISMLFDVAPPASLKENLNTIFMDFLLSLEDGSCPPNFQRIISDYHYLQVFLDKTTRYQR